MGTRRRRVGLFVVAAALSGCASGPQGPSAPADALVGPTWSVTSIDGQPVLPGTTVTASFTAEGRVGGTSGCNSYGGRAVVSGGRLVIGDLASTLMACERAGVMEQEARYLAALQSSRSYAIAGEELRLGPSETATTLVFRSR